MTFARKFSQLHDFDGCANFILEFAAESLVAPRKPYTTNPQFVYSVTQMADLVKLEEYVNAYEKCFQDDDKSRCAMPAEVAFSYYIYKNGLVCDVNMYNIMCDELEEISRCIKMCSATRWHPSRSLKLFKDYFDGLCILKLSQPHDFESTGYFQPNDLLYVYSETDKHMLYEVEEYVAINKNILFKDKGLWLIIAMLSDYIHDNGKVISKSEFKRVVADGYFIEIFKEKPNF